MKNRAAQILGRLGGKAGRGKCKARTRQQAQRAARKRWRKVRSKRKPATPAATEGAR